MKQTAIIPKPVTRYTLFVTAAEATARIMTDLDLLAGLARSVRAAMADEDGEEKAFGLLDECVARIRANRITRTQARTRLGFRVDGAA